jgi:hypothetical protein
VSDEKSAIVGTVPRSSTSPHRLRARNEVLWMVCAWVAFAAILGCAIWAIFEFGSLPWLKPL